MLNHKGTQILHTGRLLLRPFRLSDADDLFNNCTKDAELSRYMRWQPHNSVKDTEILLNRWINSYEKPDFYRWIIVLNEEPSPVGMIGLWTANENDLCGEVAYYLCRKLWGKGITSEALKAVISFAFKEVGFNRIEAYHSVNNPASGKVMQKAGMLFEGFARQKYRCVCGFQDSNMYAILKSDFIKTESILDSNL
jgi:ribosomal-protein-alanine N-acetyltransferase